MGVRLVQKTESTTPADHCIGTVFHVSPNVSIIFRIHLFYVIFVQVNMETEAAVSTADTDQQISAVFAFFFHGLRRITVLVASCGILWRCEGCDFPTSMLRQGC